MKRVLIVTLAVLLTAVGTAAPAMADESDQKSDTKVTKEMCKKGGWKDLTDEDGNSFKNQGQCVSHAAQGGELEGIEPDSDFDDDEKQVTVSKNDAEATAAAMATSSASTRDSDAELTMVDGRVPWDGYLEGTGFTPGESITDVSFKSDRVTLVLTTPIGTEIDEDGAFQTPANTYWCTEFDGHGETSGTITVRDSSGFSYSQTFDMEEYCLPGE